MTPLAYTILAYAIGLALLWGYAATLRFGIGAGEASDDNGDRS